MIRRFETRDLDEVMSLWLHANIEIHSFIEADYWKKNYDMVRKLIPEAEVFVAQEMAPDRLFSKQAARLAHSSSASASARYFFKCFIAFFSFFR